MGCPTVTVKVSTIVFNVIFALYAIGTIVYIACNPDVLLREVAISCYVLCALAVLGALLGCIAVIRESVCLAATCAIFLLILAILQIVGVIFEMNHSVRHIGANEVEHAWEHNKMDALQIEYGCCGKSSVQDYVLIDKPIPASCYADQKVDSALLIIIEGCSYKLQEYYDSEHFKLIIVSWIMVAYELLGFLLSVFLVINFRNKERRENF